MTVSWAGSTPGMGWHVEATGEGCRELEAAWRAAGTSPDWPGYLGYLRALGCSFSRADVACDDHAGHLDLAVMQGKMEARELTSRWQKWRPVYPELALGETPSGPTLYLGSTKSDLRMRVYNKEEEQKKKGNPTAGHWVRCELQARNARADAVVAALCEAKDLSAIAGILRGLVEFREAGEDTNVSRWAVSPWWDAFLSAVSRVSLVALPKVRTIETVRRWVREQVSPSLALLMTAAGGDVEELLALAREGLPRLSMRHRAMLAAAA